MVHRYGYKFITENNECLVNINNVMHPLSMDCFFFQSWGVTQIQNNSKWSKTNDLNPTPTWHCWFRHHTSEMRAQKLHTDGPLKSFDFELFDTCEYTWKADQNSLDGHCERASNLLEIVHPEMVTTIA
jgi:hypothetical protein